MSHNHRAPIKKKPLSLEVKVNHYYPYIEQLKLILKKRNISYKKLASMVGVSTSYIRNVFSFQQCFPLYLFFRICDVLGIDVLFNKREGHYF